MQLDPHAIHIRTDGSSYPELKRASGCAAIVEYPDHLGLENELIVDRSYVESTVPRMELLAVIRALQWVREHKPWPSVSRVQVITDSRYVVENIPRAPYWRRNGWTNRYREPMSNPDLWKEFLSAYSRVGMVVHIEWTPGKKSKALKAIDKAAKSAALRRGPDRDRGYSQGAISRSMLKGEAALRFVAKGQTAVIRPYRKDVMRRAGGQNKIRFDLFSEATQTFVGSFYAYASPELSAALHRQNGYRVQFNDDAKYPQVVEILENVALPVPAAEDT